MGETPVSHSITPPISGGVDPVELGIKLRHFVMYSDSMVFDEEGEKNLKELERRLGRTIGDIYELVGLLLPEGSRKIDSDHIDYPHMWEGGADYEVYEFKHKDKTYYLVKHCSWDSGSWSCSVDIYDNDRDVKEAVKSFYESVINEVEDVKPNIIDDEIYSELEELEEYAGKQLEKLSE